MTKAIGLGTVLCCICNIKLVIAIVLVLIERPGGPRYVGCHGLNRFSTLAFTTSSILMSKQPELVEG